MVFGRYCLDAALEADTRSLNAPTIRCGDFSPVGVFVFFVVDIFRFCVRKMWKFSLFR